MDNSRLISNLDKARWILYLGCFLLITYLTIYYFKRTINADFANSPIVWRSLLENGLSSLYDWRPTPDSWYFTVYPINFFLFWLLGDDGLIPVSLTAAIFSFIIAICFSKIVRLYSGSLSSILTLLCLSIFPEIMYTLGFIQHPFAHNSTSAFGALSLLIYTLNIEKRSFIFTLLSSVLLLLGISSDMWMAPSYLLPIIISEIFIIYRIKKSAVHLLSYVAVFIVGYLHIIPKIFNIAVQPMHLVPLAQMRDNAVSLVFALGESLNVFVITRPTAYILSFIFWLFVLALILIKSLRGFTPRSYIVCALFFSIVGIISSFILFNVSTKPGYERFLVNIIPCVIALYIMSVNLRKVIFIAPIAAYLLTSIYSHFHNDRYSIEKYNDFSEYIEFLDKNNLTYGYGEFWHNSIEITWLTNGRIHITPVFGDDKYGINFYRVRPQTMRSWHTDEYIDKSPDRQFVAFSKGYTCPHVGNCISKFTQAYGMPDEILTFKYITLYVYNHKLKFIH